jgi:hypothetical protein
VGFHEIVEILIKYSAGIKRFRKKWKETGHVKVKVKQPRNRPGVAQRVPGGLVSQVS